MIHMPKFFNPDDSKVGKITYPLLPLRDIVVFPHMVAPLFVGRKKSVNALTDAMNHEKSVFLATQRKAGIDNPKEADINRLGTIGTVLQLLRLPDGTVKALVEGKQRAQIQNFVQNDEFFQVEVVSVAEKDLNPAQAVALRRAIVESFEEYAKLNKNISKELIGNVLSGQGPDGAAETAAKSRPRHYAQLSGRLSQKDRVGYLVAEQGFSQLLGAVNFSAEFLHAPCRQSIAGGGQNLFVLSEEMFESLEQLVGSELRVMGLAKQVSQTIGCLGGAG